MKKKERIVWICSLTKYSYSKMVDKNKLTPFFLRATFIPGHNV